MPAPATWAAPAVRASDAERESTLALLRRHWIEGRLTSTDLEQRVEEVCRARFVSELWHAVRELPAAPLPAAWPTQRPAGAGGAVASLVLGIVGTAFLVLSMGILFAVTLPICVCAWLLGRSARRARWALRAPGSPWPVRSWERPGRSSA